MDSEKVVIVNKNIASHPVKDNSLVYFTSKSMEAASCLLKLNPKIIEFVGGDGTFSATLNDVLNIDPGYLSGKYIRIIPCGTGNDRYKSLKELEAKGDIAENGTLQPAHIVDDYLIATINGKIKRYVFNIGGIGLDSQTLLEYENFRNNKIPSSLKYFGAATKAIHRLNGYKGLVEYTSGTQVSQIAEPVMFLFMLGKYFGGGMPINSRLINNDGMFESVILNRGTNMKLYRSLVEISLLKKSQYNNNLVRYIKPAPSLELEVLSSDSFYFESDGEIITENGLPVKVKHLRIETAGKINYLTGN